MPYLFVETDFMLTTNSQFCNDTICSAEHVSQISLSRSIYYANVEIPESAQPLISNEEIFIYAAIWVVLILRFYEISKKRGILFGLFWLLTYLTLLTTIDIIRFVIM